MRKFQYTAQYLDPEDLILKKEVRKISEREVLHDFYLAWLDMNVISYRPWRNSKDECIQDWVLMNNATEIGGET